MSLNLDLYSCGLPRQMTRSPFTLTTFARMVMTWLSSEPPLQFDRRMLFKVVVTTAIVRSEACLDRHRTNIDGAPERREAPQTNVSPTRLRRHTSRHARYSDTHRAAATFC